MGKRELLIAATFIVLGVVAYRITAPSGEADRGFSLDTLSEIWRNRNTTGQRGHASTTTSGQIPIGPEVREVRLAGLTSVEVQGEPRQDIGWTLTVEATGGDAVAAQGRADGTTLRHDALGTVTALSVRSSSDAPRTTALVLRVPSHLLLRVESARQTTIADVAAVRLENLVGDVTVRRPGIGLTGSHRNGALLLEDAGEVSLTLIGSEAVTRRTRGATSINARNGSTLVDASIGPITVESGSQHLTIVEPHADVRATGIGGEITIERPRSHVDIDARRARIALSLDRATPATIFSTEASVTLTLPSEPVHLDVVSESGSIDASAVPIAAIEEHGDSRLVAGTNESVRIAIRSQRSSVVIAPAK